MAIEVSSANSRSFGYRPGEREILEYMLRLRSSRMGFNRIARTLNLNNVRPRRGLQWYGTTVKNILNAQA